ncbi:MAG: TetR/AcrR family transcriptional regulator [Acidimicrobiales bacterium]
MPKVSDEHKDAVRRRIMDAALVCLRRSGYADITTRELLAEAGLSTGTFYNYFPSKEDLYEALAEELLADDVARLVDAADAPGASIGFGLLRLLADQAFVDPEAAVAIATFRSRLHASADAAEAIGRLNAFIVAQFAPCWGAPRPKARSAPISMPTPPSSCWTSSGTAWVAARRPTPSRRATNGSAPWCWRCSPTASCPARCTSP